MSLSSFTLHFDAWLICIILIPSESALVPNSEKYSYMAQNSVGTELLAQIFLVNITIKTKPAKRKFQNLQSNTSAIVY